MSNKYTTTDGNKKIVIYRHAEGITLNPKEYVLNQHNEIIKFETVIDALKYIKFGDVEEAEEFGIYIERLED